jgi:hypothetical protein
MSVQHSQNLEHCIDVRPQKADIDSSARQYYFTITTVVVNDTVTNMNVTRIKVRIPAHAKPPCCRSLECSPG